MSLIQEALRKQQEEMEAAERIAEPGAPANPQDEPPMEPVTPPARKSALRTRPTGDAAGQPVDAPAPAAPARSDRAAGPKPKLADAARREESPTDADKAASEQSGTREGVGTQPTATHLWPILLSVLTVLLLLALILYGSWYGYQHLRAPRDAGSPPTADVETDQPTPEDPSAAPVHTVQDLPDAATVAAVEQKPATQDTVRSVAEVLPAPAEPPQPADVERLAEQAGEQPQEDLNMIDLEAATAAALQPDVDDGSAEQGDREQDLPPPAVTTATVRASDTGGDAQPAAARWPSLTLDGFVGRGLNGTAILNGEMIPVGNVIEGVEVMLIESRSVILKYNGQLRRVHRGQTTN